MKKEESMAIINIGWKIADAADELWNWITAATGNVAGGSELKKERGAICERPPENAVRLKEFTSKYPFISRSGLHRLVFTQERLYFRDHIWNVAKGTKGKWYIDPVRVAVFFESNLPATSKRLQTQYANLKRVSPEFRKLCKEAEKVLNICSRDSDA